jgi:hypothetical protein
MLSALHHTAIAKGMGRFFIMDYLNLLFNIVAKLKTLRENYFVIIESILK